MGRFGGGRERRRAREHAFGVERVLLDGRNNKVRREEQRSDRRCVADGEKGSSAAQREQVEIRGSQETHSRIECQGQSNTQTKPSETELETRP